MVHPYFTIQNDFTLVSHIFMEVHCSRRKRSYAHGLVEVSVKKDFVPRVTHGTILHQQNLELLMGQFYTSKTLMYSRECFKPVQLV